MKKNLKRAMALSLATIAAAAMPMSNVFAADGSSEGTITASFTVDSPTLTVTVPTTVQLHVNPTFSEDDADGGTFSAVGDYKKVPLYSDPIKISNATMNDDATAGVPVVATLYTTLKPDNGVKVAYAQNQVNVNGGEKSVYVKVVGESLLKKTDGAAAAAPKPATGDVYDLVGDGTGNSATTTGLTTTATDGGGQVVATSYGSMMQIAIPGPKVGATASGESTPTYGGFALKGVANVAADWADGDLGVDLYYKVKAVNTAYDADSKIAIATSTTNLKKAEDEAAGGATEFPMMTSIKAAESITASTTITNAYNGTKIESTQTNDAYFAIPGLTDSTLTITKIGFNFTNELGQNFDYILGEEEYKTANLFCKDKKSGSTAGDRMIYINLLKTASSRPYMAGLGKTMGADVTAKFFMVFSDGSVAFQDIIFEKQS